MNEDAALVAACAALLGFAVCRPLLTLRLRSSPRRLMRTNFRGKEVPATGGGPVVLSGLVALAAEALAAGLGGAAAATGRMGAALILCLVVMHAAGAWDDGRGDERPRGFRGHLGAARGGRITGGVVKALAGGLTGAGCAALLARDLPEAILMTLAVALSANLFNLLDRAPGRAAKLWLLAFVPLLAVAPSVWWVGAAGTLGAVVAILPADLGERVMLGDAGVNPMGAVIGVGLASSAGGASLIAIVVVLLALNGAAEKWSFSRVIASNRFLGALDRLGRTD